MPSPTEILLLARQLHQSGNFAQAEKNYRLILESDPSQVDVWYGLGSVCHAQRKLADAVACYDRALQLKPDFAQVWNSRGIVLIQQGKAGEAAGSFEQAVRFNPDFAHAHSNLGNVLKEQGKLDLALACYQRAVQLKPEFPEGQNNLGNALRELGRLDEAIACYREAIRLKPAYAEAHTNLGLALMGRKEVDQAVACHRQAIRCRPEFALAHNNLGAALAEQGQLSEALASYEQAVRLDPSCAEARQNVGLVLTKLDRFAEAQASFREAMRIKPGFAAPLNDLGIALWFNGQYDEALESFDQALKFRPDWPDVRKNRALVWLVQGRYEEAWPEYEYRWQSKELPARPFAQPVWDGAPLGGKTILLHAEQGLGDTIEFIRYAPLVKARGGRVIVVCQPALIPILKSCAGIDALLPQNAALPAFDVHAPLLSLPRIFRTTVTSVPADVPYLFADSALIEHWRTELAGPEFKIGLAWRGSSSYRLDRQRSFPLSQVAPVAALPGVRLYSLQKGPGAEEVQAQFGRVPIADLGPRLDEKSGPFMDTAAVIRNLDLVISADTSIGHLAGALGSPVWLALPFVPDWRWMLHREDSPWYPNVRLFRQSAMGDWQGVFERMAKALAEQLHAAPVRRPIMVEIAPGELLDKITILQIKRERITDATKRANVETELATLERARRQYVTASSKLEALTRELREVNEALWQIEDAIRVCENARDFGPRFIDLARSVYRQNDHRARVKRQINELLNSSLIEEKQYREYDRMDRA